MDTVSASPPRTFSGWLSKAAVAKHAVEVASGTVAERAPSSVSVLTLEPSLALAPVPKLALAAVLQPALPPVPHFRTDFQVSTRPPDLVGPGRETRRRMARVRRARRVGAVGGAAVLVGAMIAAGAVSALERPVRPLGRHPALTAAPVRTQRTMLFALADPGGDEAALLASDPVAGTSSVTLLPSRVVTSVVGQGQVPLGEAVALTDASTAAGSISDLLGVDVDSSWRVTPAGLSSLIDSLGGVTVDVDTQVVSSGVVVVATGTSEHLNGSEAVSYAQYLAQGEDETARLARLQRVLQSMLAELRGQASQLPSGLSALGPASDASVAPGVLATQLRDVSAGNARAAIPGPTFAILPVTTIDSGGATTVYRVDQAAMRAYVEQNLAASVPPGARAGGTRVYVYSGTLQYGLGTAARRRLVDAGLSFVGSANAAAPSADASVILVPDGTQASRTTGMRVAKALGLPASSLEVSNVPQDVADVIVIAGGDFRF